MIRKFELTEVDIREAIAAYVQDKMGVPTNARSVILTTTEARDAMDRVSYGYVTYATVTEADNG